MIADGGRDAFYEGEIARTIAKYMKENGGGSVVMIATMVEHKPMATQGGYGASKSALRAATKHLALECLMLKKIWVMRGK